MGCVNSKKPVKENTQPLGQSKVPNANNIPSAADRMKANNENLKYSYDPKNVNSSAIQQNREPIKQSQLKISNLKQANQNERNVQGSKINQLAASKINDNNPVSNQKMPNQFKNSYDQQFPDALNQQSKIIRDSNVKKNVDYDQMNSKSPDRQLMENSRKSNPTGLNMNNTSIDAVREQGNFDFNLGVSKFDIKVSVME